jgi:pimeloyl-ACP methyl ester carboxylesterase
MLDTRKGTRVRVLEAGPADGRPVVFLHGVAGLLDEHAFLDLLAQRYRVLAPELPGYGESTGEELLEDMLDFALHGWDVVEALGVSGSRPVLIGHSMGGMIAAEMACLAPASLDRLVLVDPFGLWLDEHPIPDLFSFLPFEFGDMLFHDPSRGAAMLTGGLDLSDDDVLREFFVVNARRLGTAGKILFPIPNRRVSKRLYRAVIDTLVVWGESDRLVPPAHADRWAELLPCASVARIAEAGHMVPYEQPEALAKEVVSEWDDARSHDVHEGRTKLIDASAVEQLDLDQHIETVAETQSQPWYIDSRSPGPNLPTPAPPVFVRLRAHRAFVRHPTQMISRSSTRSRA